MLFADNGKWFTAKQFNDITFGELSSKLSGHQLEHVKVKSILAGSKGKSGEKANSMTLLRMVKKGFVRRTRQGRIYHYQLSQHGWEKVLNQQVRMSTSIKGGAYRTGVIGRAARKAVPQLNITSIERYDPGLEARNIAGSYVELSTMKLENEIIHNLYNEHKYREVVEYLNASQALDKQRAAIERKKTQFTKANERFIKKTGKDWRTFLVEEGSGYILKFIGD